MSTIIDDLETDHARFRRYLTAYQKEINKLAAGVGPDLGLLEYLAKYFSQFPDELHHKKEDIIYARLEDKARPKRESLENLHAQHEELSQRARHFAEIVKHMLSDEQLPIIKIVIEAESYAEVLAAHMRDEEETLFTPARRLFRERDWLHVNEKIADLYALDINFEKARRVLDIEGILDNFLDETDTGP